MVLDTRTGWRNTETTINFNKTRGNDSFEVFGAMSLAVNPETKVGSYYNPSIVSHNIKSLSKSKRREEMGNTTCKPCWVIF